MTNEQIKQRINYLVQHGGIWDDPLDELRRRVRLLSWMTAAACGFGVVGLILLLQ